MKSMRKNRRGGMAIEFALSAPIFFLMMFAGVEFSRVHMIQCAIENAAFEGARRGIVPGATVSECKNVTEELLQAARIKDFNVTVEPASITAATSAVLIRVEIPINNANGFGVVSYMRDRTLQKTVELPCEQAQLESSE